MENKFNAARDNFISLGGCTFVRWETLQFLCQDWADAFFGHRVDASAERDDTDVNIVLSQLQPDDLSQFEDLVKSCGDEQEYNAKEEFCTGWNHVTLDAEISLHVIGRSIMPTYFQKAAEWAVAVSSGVYFMEKELPLNMLYPL